MMDDNEMNKTSDCPAAGNEDGKYVSEDSETSCLNVLLVDDHPANILVLEQQLLSLGYTITTAEDGAQALELAKKTKFDLVLTDCCMPVMDGYELTRQLRALESPPSHRYWIVGVTALAQQDERLRCLQSGMDDCLFKPVTVADLKSCISSLGIASAQADNTGNSCSPTLLDKQSIAALTNGNSTLLDLFIKQLHASNETDLSNMYECLKTRHWEDFSLLVHRVKGVARLINSEAILAPIDKFEHAFHNASPEIELQSLAYDICAAVNNLQHALLQEINTPPL